MNCDIFDYGMNGEGVGKIDGKIVLLQGALKGENVDFEIEKDNKNYLIGKLTKICSSSKNRVNPPCPYFSICGGCDLQHMSYQEQLKFKQLLVKKTIKKISGLDVYVDDTIPSNNQYKYRNKVSFSVKNEVVGFYKFNTKNIVEIDNCLLASDDINKVLNLSKNYFKGNDNFKFIKNIVVRNIGEQILVGIVASKEIVLNEYLNLLLDNFKQIGLYQIINNRRDAVVLSGKTKFIGGIKEIEINNKGVNYSVDLLGFHQTNIYIQDKLYDCINDLITNDETVVNGFSGQGLLSAHLAKKAKKVIGIEINKSSHNSAENLKKINKISNLTNISGDFNEKIEKFKDFSTLILDPSKKGCGKQVLSTLNFKKIIYISCNPIALSKDINILKVNYEIEKVVPFDMFPNTKNVETVVMFKCK